MEFVPLAWLSLIVNHMMVSLSILIDRVIMFIYELPFSPCLHLFFPIVSCIDSRFNIIFFEKKKIFRRSLILIICMPLYVFFMMALFHLFTDCSYNAMICNSHGGPTLQGTVCVLLYLK